MAVATRQRVKLTLIPLFVTFLIATASLAQSSDRDEYEKERNGPHGDCETSWQSLDGGLEYRAIRCLGGDELDVHAVRIDLDRWKLESAVVAGATARTVARDHNAPLAINANFFDHARKAIGIVVRDGTTVNPAHNVSWQSIFLVGKSGKASVIPTSSWSAYRAKTLMAVQAGPRLVVAGHTNRVHQSYAAARAGVCIQKSGDVIFFATPQDRKFDMYEIARIARRGEEDGGLACHDAMLFDGGHSVNLFAIGDDKRVEVSGDTVPVFVYATKK
jgi:uncharacterized protein YigE (DUF2233 family)